MDDTPIFVKARQYSADGCAPAGEAWVHVAALFCDSDGEWQVIDCIGGRGGVIQTPYWKVREEWRGKIDLFMVEYPYWNLSRLRAFLGTPCSRKKLFRYGRLTRRAMPPLHEEIGTTCCELLAMCDNGHICDWTGKPYWDIVTPDFRKWAYDGHYVEPVMMKGRRS